MNCMCNRKICPASTCRCNKPVHEKNKKKKKNTDGGQHALHTRLHQLKLQSKFIPVDYQPFAKALRGSSVPLATLPGVTDGSYFFMQQTKSLKYI